MNFVDLDGSEIRQKNNTQAIFNSRIKQDKFNSDRIMLEQFKNYPKLQKSNKQVGLIIKKMFDLRKQPSNQDIPSQQIIDNGKNISDNQFTDQDGYLQFYDGRVLFLTSIDDKKIVVKLKSIDIEQNNIIESYILIEFEFFWEDLVKKKIMDFGKMQQQNFFSLSHELRTPLNCSITNLTQLKEIFIKDRYPKILLEEYIDPSLISNKLLLNFINDMLDSVQIDQNKMKIIYKDFQVSKLFDECYQLFKQQTIFKNQILNVEISQDVPNIINSDQNRIRQIILNLISNAHKFTKSNGIITLYCKLADQDILQIGVKDTGIGIPQHEIPKIFSFLVKRDLGENQEMNLMGCGIGLPLSNKICKIIQPQNYLFDGIQVNSELGQGSNFYFFVQNQKINSNINLIQLQQDINELKNQDKINKNSKYYDIKYYQSCQIIDEDDLPQDFNKYQKFDSFINNNSNLFRPKSSIYGCSCSQILIVDDNSFNIISLINILKSIEYQIKYDQCMNGQDAINQIIDKSRSNCCQTYKIIFQDLELNDMNGERVVREILQYYNLNKIQNQAHIVALSANKKEEFLTKKLLQIGFHQYYEKPIRQLEIQNLIQKYYK